MALNPQAEKLNDKIKTESEFVYALLSETGKNIFFPNEGIVKQTQEAKGTIINATIGTAIDDNGIPMVLPSLMKSFTRGINESSMTYAPTGGLQELRDLWKKQIEIKNPSLKMEFGRPIVTNGLTHAIDILATLFVEEGDEIIIPQMLWGNYKLLFESLHSSKIRTFNTFINSGFDIRSMEEACLNSSKEKIILLLNFPNNPTGYAISKSEALEFKKSIEKILSAGKKIILIIDDAYFSLFYEEATYNESLVSLLSGIKGDILMAKIDGVSKEDYAWGLRIGFLTFFYENSSLYSLLEEKVLGVIRASISNISNVSQKLILNLYSNKELDKEKDLNFGILKERYLYIKELLESKKYDNEFVALPFNSGYFMSIKLLGVNAEETRKILLEIYSIGVISIGSDILRIAFSSVPKAKLSELFDRIQEVVKKLKK